MKIKKITGLILAIAAACSMLCVSAATAEVKTLKQVSEDGVKIEITAENNASYIIEIFAPDVEDTAEWTPGADAEDNTKELVYLEQGKASAKGNISTTFKIDGKSGEYTLRYSINGEVFDVESFEFDENFKASESSDGRGSSSSKGGSSSSSNASKPIALPTVTGETKEPILMDVYSDIENVIWARNAIVNLTNQGIVSGKGKDIFAPNDMVTREEFVKMLVGAFAPEVEISEKISFNDVDKNAWYYPYIEKGVNAGIVTGYSDEFFGVGQNITRQDMAVMTYRAALSNISPESEENGFSDFDRVSEYAKTAVSVMSEKGIINGKGDGKFYPNDNATRAEAAKIVYETMQIIF